MNTLFVALLLAAAPAFAQEAILVMADDGGLAPSEARAIRGVTASALRQHGVALSQDRATEGLHPVDGSLAALADSLRVERIFVLRITGRLGAKVPLTLEELQAGTLATVHSASLTAGSIEECDVVASRLAAAVVDRKRADDTAEMRTVTAQESRPFAKKPGERFFFIGLPIALYDQHQDGGSALGLSLGYGFEGESFRLEGSGSLLFRGGEGYLMLSGAWIPLAGEWSPYLGGGLGYQWTGHGQTGLGAKLEVGLEAFRLHAVRALAGVELVFPLYDTNSEFGATTHSVYPAGFIRLGF
jgi:hypothetical protein